MATQHGAVRDRALCAGLPGEAGDGPAIDEGLVHPAAPKRASAYHLRPGRLACLTDLNSEALYSVVRDPLQQAKVFSSLGDRTRILSDEGDHLRVQQFHENRLIADREVIVEWRVSGATELRTVAWRRAEDQTGTTGKNVLPDMHEGRWEISPEGGGAKVVYYVKYLPGGHIPDRMVRTFVGKGVRKVVSELFDYLRTTTSTAGEP